MAKLPETENTFEITTSWLNAFESAIAAKDMSAVDGLFISDSHWRDLVAFTWGVSTFNGHREINSAFQKFFLPANPKNIHLSLHRTPPRWVQRAGVDTIEAIFCFETDTGRGSGVLRLVSNPDAEGYAAWVLLTTLDEIKGHEEQIDERRPRGEEWSGGFGAENWTDFRTRQIAYENREPAVVVVGGSQCGLGIAASLGVLGVDTLVIDKNERVGDAWRKRYHNLVLHNEVFVDHMPYMPFPTNYPVYIPKDKIANWLEFYADTMELNVWSSSEFTGASYDKRDERWRKSARNCWR